MKKQLFFTAFSLVATAVFAQKTGGVVQSQEIIRNFDARLIDAEKQKAAPLLPAVDTSVRAQTYNIQPRTVNVDYLAPKLRPIPVKAQPIPPVYHGYIKAGYGLPNSPYAEAAYNIAQAKNYNVNVKANIIRRIIPNLPISVFRARAARLRVRFLQKQALGSMQKWHLIKMHNICTDMTTSSTQISMR